MPKAKKFYVQPRRGGQWVITVRQDGKTVAACPRDRYKHLDGQPRHNVEHWISENLDHPEPRPLSDQSLTSLVERFVAYCRDHLRRADGTCDEHKRHLLNHVIPYFLSRDPPLRDLNKWPSASVKMYSALKGQDEPLTDHQVFRCNVALRTFYRWLKEEGEVLRENILLLRGPNLARADEDTPLEVFLDPQQVLDMAAEEKNPDYARYLILGYFFSLRPQEIFGLRVDDFRAGEEVFTLEASKAMKGLTLYGGFVVNIHQQRNKKKALTPPKKNSKGWVACFNRDAAKAFVRLLGEKAPEQFVLDDSPNAFYKNWPYDFEPKDLRRASLYWLGHNTEMTIVQMMKHARQKSQKSLELYLRRPEEVLKKWKGLSVADL